MKTQIAFLLTLVSYAQEQETDIHDENVEDSGFGAGIMALAPFLGQVAAPFLDIGVKALSKSVGVEPPPSNYPSQANSRQGPPTTQPQVVAPKQKKAKKSKGKKKYVEEDEESDELSEDEDIEEQGETEEEVDEEEE